MNKAFLSIVFYISDVQIMNFVDIPIYSI